jgi:hypothetical protein
MKTAANLDFSGFAAFLRNSLIFNGQKNMHFSSFFPLQVLENMV